MNKISDAVKELSTQWHENSTGYAIIMLDLRLNKATIKDAVAELKQGVYISGLPYLPKLVQVGSTIGGIGLQQSRAEGISYEISKPIRKQDFIKMFKKLNYNVRSET